MFHMKHFVAVLLKSISNLSCARWQTLTSTKNSRIYSSTLDYLSVCCRENVSRETTKTLTMFHVKHFACFLPSFLSFLSNLPTCASWNNALLLLKLRFWASLLRASGLTPRKNRSPDSEFAKCCVNIVRQDKPATVRCLGGCGFNN